MGCSWRRILANRLERRAAAFRRTRRSVDARVVDRGLRNGGRRRVRGLACALAGLVAGLEAPPLYAEPECLDDVDVCLEVKDGAIVRFVASNRTAAPHSLRISLQQLSNLRPIGTTPFRAVLEPGEQRVVGSLASENPELGTHYRFEWGAAAA